MVLLVSQIIYERRSSNIRGTRCSRIIVLLFTLLGFSSCSGFHLLRSTPLLSSSASAQRWNSVPVTPRLLSCSGGVSRGSRVLHDASDDEENENENEKENDLVEPPEARTVNDKDTFRFAVKKGLGKVFLALSFIWSYAIIALGTLLSVGLLLNILGYGYQLTEYGIVIDTLDQMRKDQQFQQAVVDSMKSVSTE
jgi:hypothetical protein